MIIYSVTLKIDWSIQEGFEDWMKKVHIPEVLGTGCFTKNTFARLLEVDDTEGPTYSSQYMANERSDYDRYMEQFANTMRQHLFDRFGNRFIAFRSILEVIN